MTAVMARQEESQFEDAFEDPESEHYQSLKTATNLPPQPNGHMEQLNPEGINGDLPESENMEADYDANGEYYEYEEDYDREHVQQEEYVEDVQYREDDGSSYDNVDPRDTHDGQEYHADKDIGEVKENDYDAGSDEYADENDNVEGNDYVAGEAEYVYFNVETNEYSVNSGFMDGQNYEDEYEQDNAYGDSKDFIQEGDTHDPIYNAEDVYTGNEYAEDDEYVEGDNYANEEPEDVSESDQFVSSDLPLGSDGYVYGGGTGGIDLQGDHVGSGSDQGASSADQLVIDHIQDEDYVKDESDHANRDHMEDDYQPINLVDKSYQHFQAEEDSEDRYDIKVEDVEPESHCEEEEEHKQVIQYYGTEEDQMQPIQSSTLPKEEALPLSEDTHLKDSVLLSQESIDKDEGIDEFEDVSKEDLGLLGTAFESGYSTGSEAKNNRHLEEQASPENIPKVVKVEESLIKIESDSAEADQEQIESLKNIAPSSPERKIPFPPEEQKEIPKKVESKPVVSTQQYKKSKELESILHSNLNALISQKGNNNEPKVIEKDQLSDSASIEADISGSTDPPSSPKVKTSSERAIQKKPEPGPPRRVRSQQGQHLQGRPPQQGPQRTRGPIRKGPGGPRPAPPHGSQQIPAGAANGPPRRERPQPGVSRGQRPPPPNGDHQPPVARNRQNRGANANRRPAPGAAQPVSVLQSKVQTEIQEILNLEKNLASTNIRNESSVQQHENAPSSVGPPRRRAAGKHGREIDEYASATELRNTRVQNGKSSSMHNEEPRNNSNANHLLGQSHKYRGGSTRPRPYSADFTSSSRYDMESLAASSGEVVFDDIAECNEYLSKKTDTRETKDSHWQRRRRNSYEMANRSSSEEEDGSTQIYNQQLNLSKKGIEESILTRLVAEKNDGRNSDEQPDSGKQSTTSDLSTPSTPGSLSNTNERRPKLPPGINPLEYDAVGLRLAGHVADSTLNLSNAASHPEADQFSDAEEDEGIQSNTRQPELQKMTYLLQTTQSPIQQSFNSAPRNISPTEIYQDPVDINKTMEELKTSLTSNRAKAPTFYVDDNGPSPIWILKPEVAAIQEEEDRKRRVQEDKQRRLETACKIRQQEREINRYSTNPQCYQRQDEEETEPDTDTESKQLMSDQDQKYSNPSFASKKTKTENDQNMRAPDLPPTTGKIKEVPYYFNVTSLQRFPVYTLQRAVMMYKARGPHDETALTRGIVYPAAYLGSTQLITTKQPTRKVRMQQAQEAVNRIKAPEGEEQPSKEVDLAISNERIRVLNADSQETMMDHPLKTISYIADIGNIVVIMARRRTVSKTLDEAVEESGVSVDGEGRRQPRKIICHVFETEDAQLIAQTIGQAFALAYLEFLKVNGIEDPHVQEMDYHDVLNSQEIYGDDLMLFSNKECEKEALVEKERGEIMGMVIVESGWGSLIPTVVVANMSPFGAAARSGKLNIGDQIMSINGTSLVGLPLTQCQSTIKSLKSQALVKFNIVSCPPVTQVLIKRPDTKYQLGFSVQNGIICSLMRGGIAERGGVRVGHRIIEINGTSVVATPHEKIVDLLSTSVGEIRMKTMPLSMYKLLTGQEQPVYI